MELNKIRKDFKQRYEKDCEDIFFAGLPVIFFGGQGEFVSVCLSLGECLAFSKRDDGRITMQFSENDRRISFNIDDLLKNKKEQIAKDIINLNKVGIQAFGGDFFLYKNSVITNLSELLLMGTFLMNGKNVPNRETLLAQFDNFTDNVAALSGKKGFFSVYSGQRMTFLPFFSNVKIVLSMLNKKTVIKKHPENSMIQETLLAIRRRDPEKFGELLDNNTKKIIDENSVGELAHLFDVARSNKDSYGNGILSEGGIYSVVCEDKIDTFIHNVSAKYQKFYGGVPDFYVTEPVDSGVFLG